MNNQDDKTVVAYEPRGEFVFAPEGLVVEFWRGGDDVPVVMRLVGWQDGHEYVEDSLSVQGARPVMAATVADAFGWEHVRGMTFTRLPDGRLWWGWGEPQEL